MTAADILAVVTATAADCVHIEDADIDAGMTKLGLDPTHRLTFAQAVISAFILAALDDDPNNVHQFVDHHMRGWTVDKAAILAQTEEATLDRCVAILAASGERAA